VVSRGREVWAAQREVSRGRRKAVGRVIRTTIFTSFFRCRTKPQEGTES